LRANGGIAKLIMNTAHSRIHDSGKFTPHDAEDSSMFVYQTERHVTLQRSFVLVAIGPVVSTVVRLSIGCRSRSASRRTNVLAPGILSPKR
jgi:hypothetical protein